MLRYTWLRMLAVLTVMALLVAACGDDPAAEPADDGDDPVEEETEEPVEEETDEPTDEETEEPTDEETEEPEEEEEVEVGDIDTSRLVLGNLLPETGDLAFLGPPMISATEMAVQEINEAGGVLGQDVQLLPGDSGDGDGTVANQTVDRHLAAGVNAIIGAAASGISQTVIDKITGNGIIQFSPANTSPTFTDYPDNGLYFRTAPTDALQGPVLAEQVVEDGGTAIAILARSDDYGRGLAEATRDALEDAGAEVVEFTIYDQGAENFEAEVQGAAAQSPDAVVIIGFDETARILSSMIEQGIGPADVAVYGADGNASNDLATQTNPDDPSILDGMRGTRPAAEQNDEFLGRLAEFDPALTDTSFAAESYDAVVLLALAAQVAGTTDPVAVAAEINEITREGGTACSSFADCLAAIEAGDDISYEGILGLLSFTDAGEPGSGTYDIWEIGADGQLSVLRTAEVNL